jgi:formamidopyrimidine-DNA glycosylase
MFELPECLTLARQINETLSGMVVRDGILGNRPHKFVWYNRSPAEFQGLTTGKRIGQARARGRWIFIPLDPGHVLLLGECGGKVLYHPTGSRLPGKYHLCIKFEDGSFFTATTQMWGAMELYESGQEQERQYVKGMKTTPVDPDFTFQYFSALIDSLLPGEKRSAKGLLTQDQLIPGLGNAIAQDILFRAQLHPRHPIDDMNGAQRRRLWDAIVGTVRDVIAAGGRYDEYDLHGNPGKYVRIMDSRAAGRPCPSCRTILQKIQYLGGTCYFCPECQK